MYCTIIKLITLTIIFSASVAPVQAISWRLRFKAQKLERSDVLSIKFPGGKGVLDQAFYRQALAEHAALNAESDTYFNPRFLHNTAQVRALIRDTTQQDHGIPFCLDGVEGPIHGTFFNRSSVHIVFITGGFSNNHEYMASFIKVFPEYDLVFFDLPGHGFDRPQSSCMAGKLSDGIVGVDLTQITLGQKEAAVITHVVSHFKSLKYYKTAAAVGRCYSVPFFAQAAAEWQKDHEKPLFDKFIIDSAFPSFERMAQNFPRLFSSRSNAPLWRDLSSLWPTKIGFVSLANCFLPTRLSDCRPLAYYLNQLRDTDLLFIASRQDVAISMADFDEIWQGVPAVDNKIVVFTHTKHAMTHFKQKELYKALGQAFIEQSFDHFVSTICH